MAARKPALPTLSSPDRVVYPDVGITKRQVFDYYAAVAQRLLEDSGERLMSVVRCPDGIQGERFFQKHLGPAFGKSLHRVEIAENDGKLAEYAWLDDLAGRAVARADERHRIPSVGLEGQDARKA